MPTLLTSGTQTISSGTETSLVTDTSNRNFVLVLDTSALINGEAIEVRVKTKVLSGDSAQLAYLAIYANVQSDPNKYSLPVPANIYFEATLKRVAGSTNRDYKWCLLAL